MDDLQFYPTPAHLGAKICSMFECPPSRVLEPSAGNGDLVKAIRRRFLLSYSQFWCMSIY